MDTLRSILIEIQSGTTSFEPASSSDQDMWDFQPIAKILMYANAKNYLESCVKHIESDTSHSWYDLIVVRGGLTFEGEQYLAQPENPDSDKSLVDVIILKPSVFGIGVDLGELWKRWKNRKNDT